MACVNHPEAAEATRCDLCLRPFCDSCYVIVVGQALCGGCKDDFVRRLEHGELPSAYDRQPPAWERQPSLRSFGETLKACLLAPGPFFDTLPRRGGLSYLGFALLAAWPATVIGQVLWAGLQAIAVGAEAGLVLVGVYGGMSLFMTPVQILMQVLVGGLIGHGCLKLAGGANAPIEGTLRAYAYVQAASIFSFVPLLGWAVAGLWALVLQVVALRGMHETSWARAIVAVLLPPLICCILVVPFFLLVWLAGRGAQ